jgi:phosphopantetheinyl transferase (holo-ACP synthase)
VRVGLDVIEIARIRRALERPGFRERCFTETEREYCDARRTKAWAENVRAGSIDVSMTHSKELAAAICVVLPADA